MQRRDLLRVAAATGTLAFGGSLWRQAVAMPAPARRPPYGPLGTPDTNGLRLPAGFTSRVVARSMRPVAGTAYRWHPAPDGGACFAAGTGWIYVSNSEVMATGGASAIRFRGDGSIAGAYRILSGTDRNCAGGATPWGSWLSCEEVPRGRVFETDPLGLGSARVRPALGRFQHEAAAVDPMRKVVYLTEDEPDGCFYRFRATAWPGVTRGVLEVLATARGGGLSWSRVPDPSAARVATRYQVNGARRFRGGEGCFFGQGLCWFTTKHDNRVWCYDAGRNALTVVYDDTYAGAPLTGVDNVTGSRAGELFVAEDAGSMEICVVDPGGVATPFLRITGQDRSEITGPAFSPDGSRLYFSSQRGGTGRDSGGITYEVRGPFRRR